MSIIKPLVCFSNNPFSKQRGILTSDVKLSKDLEVLGSNKYYFFASQHWFLSFILTMTPEHLCRQRWKTENKMRKERERQKKVTGAEQWRSLEMLLSCAHSLKTQNTYSHQNHTNTTDNFLHKHTETHLYAQINKHASIKSQEEKKKHTSCWHKTHSRTCSCTHTHKYTPMCTNWCSNIAEITFGA